MCHVGLELDSTYYLTTLKAVQGIRGASWRYEKRPQIAGCTSLKVWNFQSFIFDTYWPIQPELIQIKNTLKQRSQPNMFLIFPPYMVHLRSDPDSKDISGDVSKYVLM
jgi:hypothetical protein